MKKIVCVLVMMMWSVGSWATEQTPDYLVYKGEQYHFAFGRLNDSIYNYLDCHKDRGWNTALWRGYIATFEMEDNQLYLTKVMIRKAGADVAVNIIEELYPNQERVKADWITGIVVGGKGGDGSFSYLHDFKNYAVFEVEEGNVTQSKELSRGEYNRFKKRQIKALKKTEEYQTYYNKLNGFKEDTPIDKKDRIAHERFENWVLWVLPKFLTD